MRDLIVYHIALGFGLSMLLYFIGQGPRLMCEIIDHMVGR